MLLVVELENIKEILVNQALSVLPAQFFAEFLLGTPMQSVPDRFKEKLIFIQQRRAS